jgi:hypothetical protein
LAYADDVTIVGENIDTIQENTKALLDASMEVGLEMNPEKIKYIVTYSRVLFTMEFFALKIQYTTVNYSQQLFELTYNLYSFFDTTDKFIRSLSRSQRHNHRNVSVTMVALLRKRNNPIVTQQGADVLLPRKPNMPHCPLLKAARPEQPPGTAPVCPGEPLSSSL